MTETPNRENRIAQLSKRFNPHAVGRQPAGKRSRERHSFYLDSDLVQQLNSTYRNISHDLHPKVVNKSQFLEALIEYGLQHLDTIQATLAEREEKIDTADNP